MASGTRSGLSPGPRYSKPRRAGLFRSRRAGRIRSWFKNTLRNSRIILLAYFLLISMKQPNNTPRIFHARKTCLTKSPSTRSAGTSQPARRPDPGLTYGIVGSWEVSTTEPIPNPSIGSENGPGLFGSGDKQLHPACSLTWYKCSPKKGRD